MVHLEKKPWSLNKNFLKSKFEVILLKHSTYLQYQNYAPSAAMLSV